MYNTNNTGLLFLGKYSVNPPLPSALHGVVGVMQSPLSGSETPWYPLYKRLHSGMIPWSQNDAVTRPRNESNPDYKVTQPSA
jgi:hypothetical protein